MNRTGSSCLDSLHRAFPLGLSDLIIEQAAPVSGNVIYVPEYFPITTTKSKSLRVNEILTLANVRTIGTANNLTHERECERGQANHFN